MQWNKKPGNNCIRKKGRQLYFVCIILPSRPALFPPSGNFPAKKSSPQQKRKNGVSDQLPTVLKHCTKVPHWFLHSKIIEWLDGWKKKKKKDPTICCLQETHFSLKDTHRLKWRNEKKICCASWNWKRIEITMLISDKTDCKLKIVTKDKDEHCIIREYFMRKI